MGDSYIIEASTHDKLTQRTGRGYLLLSLKQLSVVEDKMKLWWPHCWHVYYLGDDLLNVARNKTGTYDGEIFNCFHDRKVTKVCTCITVRCFDTSKDINIPGRPVVAKPAPVTPQAPVKTATTGKTWQWKDTLIPGVFIVFMGLI